MRVVRCAALGFALLFSTATPQVVQWDIERRHDQPQLRRRADATHESPIKNDKSHGGYFATVQIGNPAQNLTLQIDTGSSDIWVPYSDSSACVDVSSSNPGCTLGSYDPDKSKSFDDVGRNMFEIQYEDDSFSEGDYFTDDFTIRGTTVQNLTMGLGLKTSVAHGLIGLGYTSNEASIDTVDTTYPNLPVAMEQDGLINTVAYSLWLNDLGASTGSILFGGIDTSKYVGDLTRIEILPDERQNNFTHFTVAMTSLEASSPSGTDTLTSTELPIHAVLDAGSTLSYLPDDMANQLWQEIGATYESAFEMAVVPCSFSNHPGQFSFGFSGSQGPRINVTMDEMILDLTNGEAPQFTSGPYEGEIVCECGVQNQSSGPYILGDTFLRSAYVVYDLVNNEIGLAATDFNSTESNVVAFESNGATIPSATVAPSQTDSTDSSTPTQTDLSASNGFQSQTDESAAPLTSSSRSGAVAVGLTMLSLLAENWISVGQWLL